MILAVDPGLTTGLAFRINDGQYETLAEKDYREVYKFILEHRFETVVIEQFITSNIHSHRYGIRTAELVGGVEAICYVTKTELIRRTPHQRLPYMHKAAIMLKDRRHVDHEIDALAQLLAWEGLQK